MRHQRVALGELDDGVGELRVVDAVAADDRLNSGPVERPQRDGLPLLVGQTPAGKGLVGVAGPDGENDPDMVVTSVTDKRGQAAEVGGSVGVVNDERDRLIPRDLGERHGGQRDGGPADEHGPGGLGGLDRDAGLADPAGPLHNEDPQPSRTGGGERRDGGSLRFPAVEGVICAWDRLTELLQERRGGLKRRGGLRPYRQLQLGDSP